MSVSMGTKFIKRFAHGDSRQSSFGIVDRIEETHRELLQNSIKWCKTIIIDTDNADCVLH